MGRVGGGGARGDGRGGLGAEEMVVVEVGGPGGDRGWWV